MKRKYIHRWTRVPPAPATLVKAEYLQDWDILLTYDNGEKRVTICDDLAKMIYEDGTPLMDHEFFKNEVKVVNGILCWSEDIDCDDDATYYVSVPYDEYIAEKPLKGQGESS